MYGIDANVQKTNKLGKSDCLGGYFLLLKRDILNEIIFNLYSQVINLPQVLLRLPQVLLRLLQTLLRLPQLLLQ